MDDEKNNRSIEPLKVENREGDETEGEETEEGDAEEFDDDDDGGDREGQQKISEVDRLPRPVGAELPVSQSETLAGSDLRSDFVTCSRSLSEVPVEYTMQPHELAESKCQVEVSHQQALSSVAVHDAQTRTQALPSSSPTATQSNSSAPSPTLNEHRVSSVSNSNSMCVAEMDQKNSSDRRIGPTLRIVRTPSTDGYNWRKYGQKQVKIPQGSRSYYKCTYSECYAKKIECCDHSNCVTEIIYKGQHNHEPPRKVNYARESGLALSVVESNISNLATSSKEPKQEVPETYRQNSSGSDGNAEVIAKEHHVDEPEPKRRVKKSSPASAGALFKPGKKPKLVVHAAGDVGISGDGYRWRKYGQKMVKGNPHPRNYYRCTSAGCPVRKHIERAIDNSNALIITYKGKHDHDMPVPKKRHGPPSACLVAAAAPASMNDTQFKRTEPVQSQMSATQWSVDMEGELTGEALDLGGEKAMESARTLLSIGFEIKPC